MIPKGRTSSATAASQSNITGRRISRWIRISAMRSNNSAKASVVLARAGGFLYRCRRYFGGPSGAPAGLANFASSMATFCFISFACPLSYARVVEADHAGGT
jgi:hypothetical protein